MYSILEHYLSTNHILMIGMIVTFILTFFLLEHPFSFLPSDQGRAFAVNGSLSKGKLRGVGFIFVLCFLISSVLFLPIDVEYVIYAILLFAMMISGYLDDASKTPWNEYKKGLIDLVISVVAVLTYMNFNSTTICFGADEIVIPKALFLILGVILIWVSVNVTNCTDGVDGLCASLCSVTLLAFGVLFAPILQKYAMANFLFLSVLLFECPGFPPVGLLPAAGLPAHSAATPFSMLLRAAHSAGILQKSLYSYSWRASPVAGTYHLP